MQSQFGKAQTGRTTCRPRWARGLRHISWLCGLTCEQSALLGPIQGQIEFCQTRCGELAGLPALQDRFDQLRAQKGETNQPPDVAPGEAVTLGQRLQRQRAAGGQLVKPRAPARDRFDQRRIASRAVVRAAEV